MFEFEQIQGPDALSNPIAPSIKVPVFNLSTILVPTDLDCETAGAPFAPLKFIH